MYFPEATGHSEILGAKDGGIQRSNEHCVLHLRTVTHALRLSTACLMRTLKTRESEDSLLAVKLQQRGRNTGLTLGQALDGRECPQFMTLIL